MDHSMLNAVEEPELGLMEMGYMVGKHPIDARTFAVYVPKVMPLISFGSKKETGKISINKSIFINDKEAKPSVSSTVETQNYITIKLYPNRSTSKSSNRDELNSKIGPGNRMMIHFIDHNINTRYLDEVL